MAMASVVGLHWWLEPQIGRAKTRGMIFGVIVGCGALDWVVTRAMRRRRSGAAGERMRE